MCERDKAWGPERELDQAMNGVAEGHGVYGLAGVQVGLQITI